MGPALVGGCAARKDQVDAWARRLDELGIAHSPAVDGTVGWMLVLRDPDGLELHLYSRQRHDIDPLDRPGYGRPASPDPSPPTSGAAPAEPDSSADPTGSSR